LSLKASRPRGGAQLRDRVTSAITAAVLEELAEHGYGAFSMNAVAQRAGVGKAALYRRWPSKEPMVVEVISPLATEGAEPEDTGSFDGDLRSLLTALRDVLARPRVARIATDLFAETLRSPSLAKALRVGVAVPRRHQVGLILERAMARGELNPDIDVDVTLDILAGAFLVRLATLGAPMDDAGMDALHRMLMRALT
jgi:AcrR family transcriptional regulator